MVKKRTRTGTPVQEVDSDYGLRKRGTADKDKKKQEGEKKNAGTNLQRELFIKRGPTVWQRFPANSGLHSLSKTEVKGDLREIGFLSPSKETETDSKTLKEDSKTKGRKRLSPSGGKKKLVKTSSGSGKRSPSTIQKGNFYYAYSRTRNREEELEYKEFVSEQKYLSARHAYVRKLERVEADSVEHRRVLDNMKSQLNEALHGERGCEKLAKSRTVVDSALRCIQFQKETIDILRKENEKLREANNRLHQMKGVPQVPPVPDVTNQKEDKDNKDDKGANMKLDCRFVSTKLGPGWVEDVRLDATVVVRLKWGAKAFLQASSISPASLNELSHVSKPLREKIAQLNGKPKSPSKNAKKQKGNKSIDEEGDEEPVNLYTCPRNGPPRGVELFLSPLSDDPHFALPASLPMNPEALEETYNNVPRYRKYDVSCAGLNPIYDENDAEHEDWDWRTNKRVNDLKYMPVSWSEPTSSPWAGEDRATSRKDIARWEEERLDFLNTKSRLRRVQHELNKTKAVLRLRDKRLLDTQKTQNMLMERLTLLRNEYVVLRKRCAHLLRGISPEEKEKPEDDDSESKSSGASTPKDITVNSNNSKSPVADKQEEEKVAPLALRRSNSNGSTATASYTTRRTRANASVEVNGKSAFQDVDSAAEMSQSQESTERVNTRKRERTSDSLSMENDMNFRRSGRLRRNV